MTTTNQRVEEIRAAWAKALAVEARRGYSHPLERPQWADVDYLLAEVEQSDAALNNLCMQRDRLSEQVATLTARLAELEGKGNE